MLKLVTKNLGLVSVIFTLQLLGSIMGPASPGLASLPSVFGRRFVKRFTLCYWTFVCPLMSVYCGQMVAWIRMKLGMQVCLGPGHILLDGDPAPPSQKAGTTAQFSAHFYCVQTAGCIKMPLGTEVGLGPGHIVLDGDAAPPPSPRKRGTTPYFRPMSIVAKWLDRSRSRLAQR